MHSRSAYALQLAKSWQLATWLTYLAEAQICKEQKVHAGRGSHRRSCQKAVREHLSVTMHAGLSHELQEY